MARGAAEGTAGDDRGRQEEAKRRGGPIEPTSLPTKSQIEHLATLERDVVDATATAAAAVAADDDGSADRRPPFHDESVAAHGPMEVEWDVEGMLSPRLSSVGDSDSLCSDFGLDWEGPTIAEPVSPALRGVHKVAVEVMRKSFGSAQGDPAVYAAVLAVREERARRGEDDDDGMFEEEQSLSTKAAHLHQSLTDASVDDIDIDIDIDGELKERAGGGEAGEGADRNAGAQDGQSDDMSVGDIDFHEALESIRGEEIENGEGVAAAAAAAAPAGTAGERDHNPYDMSVGDIDKEGVVFREAGEPGARGALQERGEGVGALGQRGQAEAARKLPPAEAVAAAAAAAAVAGGAGRGCPGSGSGHGSSEEDGKREGQGAVEVGGRDRREAASGGGAGGVGGGVESGRDKAASSSASAEDGGSSGGGELVTRAIARRPLREMLRLESEEAGEGGVARLEHLPAFTERWAPEALTPEILSQVFSGLVPVASGQGQSEPVCTYMLECCVRPDVKAITILHVASLIAANHGLELIRKRGGQVLFGVAPPTSDAAEAAANAAAVAAAVTAPPHRRNSEPEGDREEDADPPLPSGSPSIGNRYDRSGSIVLPASPGSPAATAATAAAPLPPPSPTSSELGAAAAAATAGAEWGKGSVGGESRDGGEGVAKVAGEGGGGTGGAASSPRSLGSVSPTSWRGAVGGPAELRGWWGAGGAGWGSWSHVDMQLVVGQASKHRVLLIRFVTSRSATSRDVSRLAEDAAENGEPLAIAPAAQGFVSGVRHALRERGALLESLEGCPAQRAAIEIDAQFLNQVERMCQYDMVASLREAGVSLDEHARNEELRGVVVTRLLEEMFDLVGLPMLPPPPQLVLAMPRPNDILPSSVEPMPGLSEEDEDELASHVFASEASRITANVLARAIRYTEKCDEQMTARMQRKNRQVMQRISRSQLYQRELFQALRDGHVAIRRSKLASSFCKLMRGRPEVGIDPDLETPVYFCSIICNRRPGYLYLTYWHICVVTKVPGFSPSVWVMNLQDVDAIEIVKLFVGHGIQVRKSCQGAGEEDGSDALSPAPPSRSSSFSSRPPPPRRRDAHADDAAATAAAAAAATRVRPSSITFATTKVATAELRELMVALVRVHREPVTSPTTAERAAARAEAEAAAARRASSPSPSPSSRTGL